MIVKFVERDREDAMECAKKMQFVSKARGMRDTFGGREMRSEYIGALGEIAFARYIGAPWRCHPGETGGVPDVREWEVRTVAPGTRELALKAKANDRLSTPVVLVAILAGRDADNVIVREAAGAIMGFLTAEEIRRLGTLRDPGRRGAPAWFVTDMSVLHPVPR